MWRHVLLLVVIAPLTKGDDLSSDAGVREMFWQLLSQSRYGFSHEEEAAFVVRDRIGNYRCVAWPADGFVDSARWEGPFPDGVLAIIHTHPNWMPWPSSTDARVARTTGVPVYVITRTQITFTAGGKPLLATKGDWKPRLAQRPCSPLRRDPDVLSAGVDEIEDGYRPRRLVSGF